MNDWSSGYVSEVNYTFGYYRELSPLMLEFALLSRQIDFRRGKPMRYLELGFGQGVSLNVHAAAVPGEYWGTDFNPAQAATAQDMADASRADLRVLDNSFAELAARTDLPEFDMIVLHGIWSWISDENRQAIVNIIRHRLAPGGIVYISHTSTPGWSAAMPLRHIMTLHADLASGRAGDMQTRINGALAFAQQVADSGSAYFKQNPHVVERLKKISEQNRNYLAHEYFNADWLPMSCSDVTSLLESAKLSFAASSNLIDHVDAVNLSQEQQELRGKQSNITLRESVRDYMINQQFRRDIWIKGPRRLSAPEQARRLNAMRFVLLSQRSTVPMHVQGARGQAQVQEEVYAPILDELARNNHAPKTFGEIVEALPKIGFGRAAQAILLLVGAGHVSPAQAANVAQEVKPRCQALNKHIIRLSESTADVGVLASPVTAGAVNVTRMEQIFIAALGAGKNDAKAIAKAAWGVLKPQGHKVGKDGKALETDDENLTELASQAKVMLDTRLPILKAAGVV